MAGSGVPGAPNPKNYLNAASADLGLGASGATDETEEEKRKRLMQQQQAALRSPGASVYGPASMMLFGDAGNAYG